MRSTLCGLVVVALPVGAQDLVFIPAVTGIVRDGQPQRTIEAQTAAALAALDAQLATHGLTRNAVVAVNVFLRDARLGDGMNTAYRAFFQANPPTRATVQVDLPDPDALIQIAAIATRGPRRVIAPTSLRTPTLPYSVGIQTGNMLFIAGATSRDPATWQVEAGDVAAQTRRIFGNIGEVLREAGMDYGHLASCRVFLPDPRRFGAMNEAYREFVPADAPPARATARTGLMHPAFEVEIQCIAATGPRTVVIGEGRRPSRAPLSPGIATERYLLLSGMVSGGGDVGEQTRGVLEELRAALAADGKGFADVAELWVYVTDMRDWSAVRAVMEEVLAGAGPRPTVIGTPLMGSGLRVEIQMTAVR